MSNYIDRLVSVVIPTYKRAEKLYRAISSVLGQTYENLECIVVNDNIPNDEYSLETYKIIEQFKEINRFKFIEQKQHINGERARNVGILAARGEFIAFLDDDDYWEKEKIEKQVKFIKKQDSSCGGVSTLVKFLNNNELKRLSTPYKDGKIFYEILSRQVDVTTCSVLLKREYLDEIGYFDEALFRHQEIQLLTNFTYKYEIKLLREHLTCVDISGGENNPNLEKTIKIKQMFFDSISPIMSSLSKKEQRRAIALHGVEIALVAFREHKWSSAFKYGIKVFSSPKTLKLAVKRIKGRIKDIRSAQNCAK